MLGLFLDGFGIVWGKKWDSFGMALGRCWDCFGTLEPREFIKCVAPSSTIKVLKVFVKGGRDHGSCRQSDKCMLACCCENGSFWTLLMHFVDSLYVFFQSCIDFFKVL